MKIPGGYILLHRQLIDHPLYFAEPFSRIMAWIDLLLMANHATGYIYVRGNRIEVNRGQVGLSEDTLAQRWKWSRGKVRRFLNELENDQQIVQQKSRVKSLISVVNYNKYQLGSTTDSTTDGQQTDTNNKNKKNNKDNTQNDVFRDNDFLRFWDMYDKKKDRLKCEKKFSKLTKAQKDKIFQTLPAYVASTPDPQYRKNPLTYLNAQSWEDEVEDPTPATKSNNLNLQEYYGTK